MQKKLALIFIFSFISFSTLAKNKICILSILPKKAKQHKTVSQIFDNYQLADVFTMPSMEQIEKCFSHQYQEVIWISHGAKYGLNSNYIVPVHYDENGKFPLYRRFFSTLAKNLEDRQIKFRIAFCGAGAKNYNTSMDVFLKKIVDNGGVVEFSPHAKFSSWVTRRPTTYLKKGWLSESIDIAELISWKTSRSSHCLRNDRQGCNRNKICTSDSQLHCNRKTAKYIIPITTKSGT